MVIFAPVALLVTARVAFLLGWLQSLPEVFLSKCFPILASPTSWGLHCTFSFIITAVHTALPWTLYRSCDFDTCCFSDFPCLLLKFGWKPLWLCDSGILHGWKAMDDAKSYYKLEQWPGPLGSWLQCIWIPSRLNSEMSRNPRTCLFNFEPLMGRILLISEMFSRHFLLIPFFLMLLFTAVMLSVATTLQWLFKSFSSVFDSCFSL